MATIQDAAFAPPLVLPFPPGSSPFRQKGNAYLADVRYLDACVPGGFEAAVAAVTDPAGRAFFKQTFRASEWYDAYPGCLIEAAAARLRGVGFEAHRHQTGLWHAEDAAKRGIYSALLRLVSNENVALWGPRISTIYFEFGRIETRVAGRREVHGVMRGIPRELTQWFAFVSAGFAMGTLRLAGAKEPVVTFQEVEPDGRQHGRELMRVGSRITWD